MLIEAYYESGNAPHEALGRAARRLSDGGALYIGGGVGVEKVKKGTAETFSVTTGTGKAESFAGPLSAAVRAFTIAGGSTAIDSPGGSSSVTDPAAAARLRELTDDEASTKRDLDRYTRQLARKAAAQTAGRIPWSPSSIGSDDAWEARRIEELKADLSSIAAERAKLLASGKVEEVEQARPGTNFTKIPPKNVARLKGIIEHYKGMAHPFSACVRDQIKHGLSEDHANRRCAVVKDLAMGTTKWRKGGSKTGKMAERLLVEALGRLDVVIENYGLAATVHLAEGMDSALPSVNALAEGVSNDFGLLSLAGHPLALAVFGLAEAEFTENLHPRDLIGRFKAKVAGLSPGESVSLPDGHKITRVERKPSRGPAFSQYLHSKPGDKPGTASGIAPKDPEAAATAALDASAQSEHAKSLGGARSFKSADLVRRGTEGRDGVAIGQVYKVRLKDGSGGYWEVVDADPASPTVKLRSKRSGREMTEHAATIKREMDQVSVGPVPEGSIVKGNRVIAPGDPEHAPLAKKMDAAAARRKPSPGAAARSAESGRLTGVLADLPADQKYPLYGGGGRKIGHVAKTADGFEVHVGTRVYRHALAGGAAMRAVAVQSRHLAGEGERQRQRGERLDAMRNRRAKR